MVALSSFYNILYIVLAIFGILALGGLTGKDREKKKRKLEVKDVDIHYRETIDPIVADYFSTYVGGARYYTDNEDLRSFVGFVYFDPDDEAPRIYRNDLKMLGHIPRERLKEYVMWSKEEVYPCVGYILRGKTIEQLASEVRVIKPFSKEYVKKEIKKYVGWVTMTHGMSANISPEIYEPILDNASIEEVKRSKKQ